MLKDQINRIRAWKENEKIQGKKRNERTKQEKINNDNKNTQKKRKSVSNRKKTICQGDCAYSVINVF